MQSIVEGARVDLRGTTLLRQLHCHLPRARGRTRAPSYFKLCGLQGVVLFDCATSFAVALMMVPFS
jgi:hypothetical protein